MIDWANPDVQVAGIVALVGFVGIVVAAVAGVAGAIAGARIAASAMAREGERERQDEVLSRMRDWHLARIEATRTQLVAAADGFLALMDKDVETGRRHFTAMNDSLLANARLVGNLDALAALAAAVVQTSSVLGDNKLIRAIKLTVGNPFGDPHRTAMRQARALVLNALELQQERVLRDEPMVILTPDEIDSIPEFQKADRVVDGVRQPASDG